MRQSSRDDQAGAAPEKQQGTGSAGAAQRSPASGPGVQQQQQQASILFLDHLLDPSTVAALRAILAEQPGAAARPGGAAAAAQHGAVGSSSSRPPVCLPGSAGPGRPGSGLGLLTTNPPGRFSAPQSSPTRLLGSQAGVPHSSRASSDMSPMAAATLLQQWPWGQITTIEACMEVAAAATAARRLTLDQLVRLPPSIQGMLLPAAAAAVGAAAAPTSQAAAAGGQHPTAPKQAPVALSNDVDPEQTGDCRRVGDQQHSQAPTTAVSSAAAAVRQPPGPQPPGSTALASPLPLAPGSIPLPGAAAGRQQQQPAPHPSAAAAATAGAGQSDDEFAGLSDIGYPDGLESPKREAHIPPGMPIIPAHEVVMVEPCNRGAMPNLAGWGEAPVMLKEVYASDEEPDKVFDEAVQLRALEHPSIMRVYGIVADEAHDNHGIVFEYLQTGTLQDGLKYLKRLGCVTPQLLARIALQAADGLRHMHSRSIAHQELTSDKVMCDFSNPLRPVVKIGLLSPTQHRYWNLGTDRWDRVAPLLLPWRAPELIMKGEQPGMDASKMNVYFFGILLWEIWTLGKKPYELTGVWGFVAMRGVGTGELRPTVPQDCPPEWLSLMQDCWHNDPSCRPTFPEIVDRLGAMVEAWAAPNPAAGAAAAAAAGGAGAGGGVGPGTAAGGSIAGSVGGVAPTAGCGGTAGAGVGGAAGSGAAVASAADGSGTTDGGGNAAAAVGGSGGGKRGTPAAAAGSNGGSAAKRGCHGDGIHGAGGGNPSCDTDG